MIEAGIGVDPWTVLAQGISIHTGIGVGWVANILGFLGLLIWIPLRGNPGIGTIANILLVGTSIQLTVDAFPPVDHLGWRIVIFAVGLLLVAVSSGLY